MTGRKSRGCTGFLWTLTLNALFLNSKWQERLYAAVSCYVIVISLERFRDAKKCGTGAILCSDCASLDCLLVLIAQLNGQAVRLTVTIVGSFK